MPPCERTCGGRLPPLLALCREASGIIVGSMSRLTSPVIGKLRACRIIARAGIGTDNIDLAAAGKEGDRRHPGPRLLHRGSLRPRFGLHPPIRSKAEPRGRSGSTGEMGHRPPSPDTSAPRCNPRGGGDRTNRRGPGTKSALPRDAPSRPRPFRARGGLPPSAGEEGHAGEVAQGVRLYFSSPPPSLRRPRT